MTTNKPEVFTFNSLSEECVRLSDYEALEAECERLRNLLVEIERGCSRRDMPSEQTISSWADAIHAAIHAVPQEVSP